MSNYNWRGGGMSSSYYQQQQRPPQHHSSFANISGVGMMNEPGDGYYGGNTAVDRSSLVTPTPFAGGGYYSGGGMSATGGGRPLSRSSSTMNMSTSLNDPALLRAAARDDVISGLTMHVSPPVWESEIQLPSMYPAGTPTIHHPPVPRNRWPSVPPGGDVVGDVQQQSPQAPLWRRQQHQQQSNQQQHRGMSEQPGGAGGTYIPIQVEHQMMGGNGAGGGSSRPTTPLIQHHQYQNQHPHQHQQFQHPPQHPQHHEQQAYDEENTAQPKYYSGPPETAYVAAAPSLPQQQQQQPPQQQQPVFLHSEAPDMYRPQQKIKQQQQQQLQQQLPPSHLDFQQHHANHQLQQQHPPQHQQQAAAVAAAAAHSPVSYNTSTKNSNSPVFHQQQQSQYQNQTYRRPPNVDQQQHQQQQQQQQRQQKSVRSPSFEPTAGDGGQQQQYQQKQQQQYYQQQQSKPSNPGGRPRTISSSSTSNNNSSKPTASLYAIKPSQSTPFENSPYIFYRPPTNGANAGDPSAAAADNDLSAHWQKFLEPKAAPTPAPTSSNEVTGNNAASGPQLPKTAPPELTPLDKVPLVRFEGKKEVMVAPTGLDKSPLIDPAGGGKPLNQKREQEPEWAGAPVSLQQRIPENLIHIVAGMGGTGGGGGGQKGSGLPKSDENQNNNGNAGEPTPPKAAPLPQMKPVKVYHDEAQYHHSHQPHHQQNQFHRQQHQSPPTISIQQTSSSGSSSDNNDAAEQQHQQHQSFRQQTISSDNNKNRPTRQNPQQQQSSTVNSTTKSTHNNRAGGRQPDYPEAFRAVPARVIEEPPPSNQDQDQDHRSASSTTIIKQRPTVKFDPDLDRTYTLSPCPSSRSPSPRSQTNAAPVGAEAPPLVKMFDAQIMDGPLAEFLVVNASIGGDELNKLGDLIRAAFSAERDFVWKAQGMPKTEGDSKLMDLLSPTSNKITEIQNLAEQSRRNKMFNHISAISEGIPALGWVNVAPTPGPFVKDMLDASMFYTNRVLKEYRETDPKHVEWVKTWLGVLKELQTYVKQNHTTGLIWNSSPGTSPSSSSSSATSSTAAPPPPPPGGAPPPPPPPPPAGLFDDLKKDSNVGGDGDANSRAALFAEINRGLDVTKGLKRVTDDMKTHKNPDLRKTAVVSSSGPPKVAPKPPHLANGGSSALPAPAQPKERPPVLELEGKKWVVENFKNNREVIVNVTDMKQVIYVWKCDNSVIVVNGKVNSITMDSCKKTSIVFDALVSQMEIINCQSMQVQSKSAMPTLAIQKTDGCQVYLSQESKNAEIVTSKSSEMNILVPAADGEFKEYAVPEQYKTTFSGKGLVTEVVDV